MRLSHACLTILAPVLAAFGALASAQAQCALPYTLANGQPPDATKLMANFNALIACINVGGASNSIQYNSGSGSLGGVGPLTNGQVMIGSTGNPPQAQTLTAGTGINITNGPGNITIEAIGGVASTGLYRQVTSATPTAASTGMITWLNQGTAVVSDNPAGISISATGTGPDVVIGRLATAPPPPYKIRALLAVTRNSNSYAGVGMGWYDGTSKVHVLDYSTLGGGTPFLEVTKWSSPGSYAGLDFQSATNGFWQPMWIQLQDDGTNISFAFSQDGANFLTVFSIAKSSGYLGASGYSQLLFFINPRTNSSATIGTLMSWQQS